MNKEENLSQKASTKVINTRFQKKDVHGAIAMPIYKNAAFEFDNAETMASAFQYTDETPYHTYSRITNPTVENLERKIKSATGAENVAVTASGMAAIANTFLAIAYSGSNIITSPHLFGNTFSLFKVTLAEFGVETRFVNTNNMEEISNAIDENTCAFFCELITNPHMEIANIPAISKIVRRQNIPLIVDTTIVPWCAFKAKSSGVDIEIVSTTKYVSGGATSVGGAIIDYGTFSGEQNKRLSNIVPTSGMSSFMFKLKREILRNMGAAMDADAAYMQSLGMETLEVRYQKMSDSAFELAKYLEAHPLIQKVNYPKLEGSPYKELSDNLFTGNPGAMLTFNLKTKEDCFRFMNRLQIIRRATNLFDNKSLIIHPESTIYGSFSPSMKSFMGIEDNLLRLSVGLEDVSDLEKDIVQSLASL